MAGVGQKIKNALTPGHNRHANEGVYTESAMGTNNPIGTNAGYNNTGMGGDLVTNSVSSISSSDSEGVAGARGVHTGVANAGTGVCETRTFTEVEDRPVMRERVERIIEHRPVEKQFVVETRPVGERELTDGVHYESAGVREYEVDRVEGTKCPTTTGAGASRVL